MSTSATNAGPSCREGAPPSLRRIFAPKLDYAEHHRYHTVPSSTRPAGVGDVSHRLCQKKVTGKNGLAVKKNAVHNVHLIVVFTCESWKIEVGVENLGLGEQFGVANFAVFVSPTPTPILPGPTLDNSSSQ